jgi:hypothetical protein
LNLSKLLHFDISKPASFLKSSNCVISTGASQLLAMRSGETPVFGIFPAPTGPLATVRGCKQNTGVSPLAPLGRDDASKEGARYYEMTIQKRMRTLAGAHF